MPTGICQFRPFPFYNREDIGSSPKEGKSRTREHKKQGYKVANEKNITSFQFISEWLSLLFVLSDTFNSFKKNFKGWVPFLVKSQKYASVRRKTTPFF